MEYVLDACALIAFLNDEDGSDTKLPHGWWFTANRGGGFHLFPVFHKACLTCPMATRPCARATQVSKDLRDRQGRRDRRDLRAPKVTRATMALRELPAAAAVVDSAEM